MAKLVWDKIGNRLYETGVDHGVLYPSRGAGVVWNGLTSVNESPSGAEASPIYADNIKYLNLMSVEELGLTIEAYTYPDEFKQSLGETELLPGVTIGQQNRKAFGFSYRSLVGNDEEGNNHGYKIHVIFSCMAAPTEKGHSTVNDSPEALTFSWEISTTPVEIDGYKPSASIVLDSTKFKAAGLWNVLQAIEDILYGTTSTTPRLPAFSEFQSVYQECMYLLDSNGEQLLDSNDKPLQSTVYA